MAFSMTMKEKYHPLRMLINNQKNQTRRQFTEGQYLENDCGTLTVFHPNGKRKWYVGQRHAIKYSRTSPTAFYRQIGNTTQFAHLTPKMDFVGSWLRWARYMEFKGQKGLIHEYTWKEHLARNGWTPLYKTISGLRLEHLQSISESDAVAEGIKSIDPDPEMFQKKHLYPWSGKAYYDYLTQCWHQNNEDGICNCYTWSNPSTESAQVHSYRTLLNAVSPKIKWDDNPLVWVIEFDDGTSS